MVCTWLRNFKTFSDVTATAKRKNGQLSSESSPKSRVGLIRNLETKKHDYYFVQRSAKFIEAKI